MTKLNYGEYTQKDIDEGCKLKITSEDYYSATPENPVASDIINVEKRRI